MPETDLDIVQWRNPEIATTTYTSRDLEISPRTEQLLTDAVPENTTLAYQRVWKLFKGWCDHEGRVSLPATDATLAEFVSARIAYGDAPATISQAIGAIRKMHRLADHKGRPDLEKSLLLLRGYRRELVANGRYEKRALPILPDTLRRMIETLDLVTAAGQRDRLLLVLGFGLMGRRSELVALRCADIRETDDGIEVSIRTSKTDKDSRGTLVPIARASHPDLDLNRIVPEWRTTLASFGIHDGPLLRKVDQYGNVGGSLKPSSVNSIIKRLVISARLPNPDDYSAHSLRAGGLTAALQAGAPLGTAVRHGRWSEKSPVVIGYARAADRWRDNAMRGVL